MIEDFGSDLRYGFRMLWKAPGFTAVAILTLALGIGANTAIFSVIDTVLLRPLPYEDSGRLVSIQGLELRTLRPGIPLSYTKLALVRDQNRSLEEVAAYFTQNMTLTDRSEPEQIPAGLASQGFFHVLKVSPALGRDFLAQEDQPGGDDVALITDSFWHSHFGGDAGILGKSLTLEGRSVRLVGVLPPNFKFPFQSPEPDLWLPRVFEIASLTREQVRRGAGYLSWVGRLRSGGSLAGAQTELDTLNSRYRLAFPGFVDATLYGLKVSSLEESLVANSRRSLLTLMAAVGFVLLIACANVAGLLLTRATTREKEIAIRRTLGASRRRLLRQLLSESVLLALLGGGLGVLLATWTLPVLRKISPGTIPRMDEIGVNGIVLAFVLVMCVVTGLAFGLAPALQAARTNLQDALKEGGRGTSGGARGGHFRQILVIAEVAVALVLITGAGLLIQSLVHLLRVNPGFDPQNVLTFPVSLPLHRYSQSAQQAEFFRRLVERVERLPGVDAAGVGSSLPLEGGGRYVFFCPEGRVCEGIGKDPLIAHRQVSPDYFRALHIPLLKGRGFTDQDTTEALPVAIINQMTADRFWPGQDPIGKHISNSQEKIQRQIVGVVGDVKFRGLDAPGFEEMYLPSGQSPWPRMTLVVHSDSNPEPLVSAVRRQILDLDSGISVGRAQSMEEVISASVSQPRLIAGLVGIFAAFALALAAVGIYGVMAYSVSRRTHEMGLRMALGARPNDILRLVVRQGMRLVMGGLGIGILVALALTRMLSHLLFATSAADPLTYAGVSALLAVVALLACYLPARRATRVDPMVALKYE
ncbi:MAG: ABC transporter permease [Acidobacteriia bacterium]|nr:ABC transporter permease [Terriglobia bacterium]